MVRICETLKWIFFFSFSFSFFKINADIWLECVIFMQIFDRRWVLKRSKKLF
jgi:hypothetical protein